MQELLERKWLTCLEVRPDDLVGWETVCNDFPGVISDTAPDVKKQSTLTLLCELQHMAVDRVPRNLDSR